MQIKNLEEINQPVSFTVGSFDGIHLGHQRLLAELKSISNANNSASLVISFEPHPRLVVNPGYKLELLTTPQEKESLIAETGIDYLSVINFTKDFSRLSALEFYEKFLFNYIRPKHVLMGFNHAFGNGRSGSMGIIKELAERHSFTYSTVSAVDLLDSHVSSTAIRNNLKEGAVRQAEKMLGRYYSITGKVIKGRQIGRSLGYPTANLHLGNPQKLVPGSGVYLTIAVTEHGQYFSMTNIGINPTFPGKGYSIETHFFDFDHDLYDLDLEIRFVRKIREEQKYLHIADLIKALQHDEQTCRELIKKEYS